MILFQKSSLFWQGPYMLINLNGLLSSIDKISTPSRPSPPQTFRIIVERVLNPKAQPPE